MGPMASTSYVELMEKMNKKKINEMANNLHYYFDNYRWILGYRVYDLILKHYRECLTLRNDDVEAIPTIFGFPITIDYNNPETCLLFKEVSVNI